MKASLVICTHNPRPDFLERTLGALKSQTLSLDSWELLLVDNASESALSELLDLSWHPHARFIRENNLGLTLARVRGILESRAEIIVFVDDDVVLDADYVERAVAIGERFPFLGAWGGQCVPWFEISPPEWTKPYWTYLTIRSIPEPRWSNLGLEDVDTLPWGAGLCIRRLVGMAYRDRVAADPLLLKLDRKGKRVLTSCGDLDLALTARGNGLGTGLFPELKLTHLIDKLRLTENYLMNLIEGNSYSFMLLQSRHSARLDSPQLKWHLRILGRVKRLITLSARERRLASARIRGHRRAWREVVGSGESAPRVNSDQAPCLAKIPVPHA